MNTQAEDLTQEPDGPTYCDPTPYLAANGNRFSGEQARLITEILRFAPRTLKQISENTPDPAPMYRGKPTKTSWLGTSEPR